MGGSIVSPAGSRTADGKSIVSSWPTEGTRTTVITPNWCDPTTWHAKAVQSLDEIASDTGDHLTYQLAHINAIDVYHGKITGEDSLAACRCLVKVNDVAKAEQDPHAGSGGDYTVNYALGTITFLAPLDPADVVKATYHYANGSTFVLKPTAGKKLLIKDVEVQFSEDIDLTDTVVFQPYGYVDVFAPQLLTTATPPGPYPPGTLIPLGSPTVYKTMQNYVDEANGALPAIPAIGGASWRGNQVPIHVFPWKYQAMTELRSSYGMEIRISLEHEVPFGGTVATATFYCLSELE